MIYVHTYGICVIKIYIQQALKINKIVNALKIIFTN